MLKLESIVIVSCIIIFRIYYIATDCKTHNGYSGGGVFDKAGRLLGLTMFNLKVNNS